MGRGGSPRRSERRGKNAPLFIEAFYDACQLLGGGETKLDVPSTSKINSVLAANRVGDEPAQPHSTGIAPPPRSAPATKGVAEPQASELEELLKAVEVASSADDKGKSLEALCDRLFGTIEGFEVRNRIRTATEEIDLTIINGSQDHRLRREARSCWLNARTGQRSAARMNM